MLVSWDIIIFDEHTQKKGRYAKLVIPDKRCFVTISIELIFSSFSNFIQRFKCITKIVFWKNQNTITFMFCKKHWPTVSIQVNSDHKILYTSIPVSYTFCKKLLLVANNVFSICIPLLFLFLLIQLLHLAYIAKNNYLK
jgi:hypothetical protein